MGSGSTRSLLPADGSPHCGSRSVSLQLDAFFIELCSAPIETLNEKNDKLTKLATSTSMTPTSAADPLLARAYSVVLVVGAALTLAALFVSGWRTSLGVFAGSVIAFVNLWVLARAVQSLLGGAQMRWAAFAFLKFLALLGISFVLVRSGAIQPMPLAVGFGALPLGISIAGTLFVPATPSSAKETDHA